jgi:UPF0755 protein
MKPKKKNNALKTLMTLIFVVILILAVGSLLAYNWYNNAIFSANSSSTEEVEVTVNVGDSLLSIVPTLKASGLISSEEAVRVYLRINNVSPTIKTGTYSIAKNLTFPQLVEILEKGVFKASVTVTIREGLKYQEVGSLLNAGFKDAGEENNFQYEEFLEICEEPDDVDFSDEVSYFIKSAKPAGKPLIGFLFPDTYQFDSDSNANTVIEKMILNFMNRMEENNIEIGSNAGTIGNIYEALTLASILEKEASLTDDNELISGVFHNRLNQNYLLEADSTVNFVTGKNDPGVLISDTKIDSPYNTYKYAGLPPTPINNPGMKTIKAALNPKKTDYFYFLHDANGKSYFAITFQQHQQNINRYL